MYRPYPTLDVFPVAEKSRFPGWYSPPSYLFLYNKFFTVQRYLPSQFHFTVTTRTTGGVISRVLGGVIIRVLGVIITVLGVISRVLGGVIITVLGVIIRVLGVIITVFGGVIIRVLGVIITVLGVIITVLGVIIKVLGVIIRVLASIAVDCEFEPRSGETKHLTMKLVFAVSPLRTQTKGVGTKTYWLGIKKCVQVERHVCSRTVVLVSQHYSYQIKRVSLVQSLHNHYFIEYNMFSPRYS